MGNWGIALYQDDAAVDLKNTITLLAGLPASGDRLLEIVLENYKEGVGLDDDGGPTFWLVLADQFERRGIACPRGFEQALAAISTGADLRDFEARDASPSDLRKRARILGALEERLRSPRPLRPRPSSTRPPPFHVEVGEVYCFPTMGSEAFNPCARNSDWAGFTPDGWGAMLVIARGRVFDWFPWCVVSGLTVEPSRKPSLEDAQGARFISKTSSGQHCVPRRTHLKRMRCELLGQLSLDPARVEEVMPREDTPEYAVLVGWSFVPEARAWEGQSQNGVAVSDLLASQ
jgi:hypothetical protein